MAVINEAYEVPLDSDLQACFHSGKDLLDPVVQNSDNLFQQGARLFAAFFQQAVSGGAGGFPFNFQQGG